MLIIMRLKLHYAASGIITPVGGRLVHKPRTRRPPIGVMIQKFCASSWLITEINYKTLFNNRQYACPDVYSRLKISVFYVPWFSVIYVTLPKMYQ